MISKFKIARKYLVLKWRARRARKIHKKWLKMPERYDSQWKFDWEIKQIGKYLKAFKINVVVEGYKNIPKTNFVLAPNHQDYADIPLLMWALKKETHDRDVSNRRVVFLAKEEIKKNKIAASYANLIETFYVDRENPRQAIKVLDDLSKYLKEHTGVGVAIFPEGTRSKDGKLGEFKGGAFHIAKKNFIPIVPVSINGTFYVQKLNRDWLTISIIFHKPLRAIDFIGMSNQELANKVRNIVASKFNEPQEVKVAKKVFKAIQN